MSATDPRSPSDADPPSPDTVSAPALPEDLVHYLVRGRGLSPADARSLLHEVQGFYRESVADYVSRRHRELQLQGLRNPRIYAQIRSELDTHLFRAGPLSERQIRRLIYG